MRAAWLAGFLAVGLFQPVPIHAQPLWPQLESGFPPPVVQVKKKKAVPYGQELYADPQGLVPESVAVSQAMRAYPDGQPLGVKFLPGPPPMYSVRVKTHGQMQRVLVDATTGQLLGY